MREKSVARLFLLATLAVMLFSLGVSRAVQAQSGAAQEAINPSFGMGNPAPTPEMGMQPSWAPNPSNSSEFQNLGAPGAMNGMNGMTPNGLSGNYGGASPEMMNAPLLQTVGPAEMSAIGNSLGITPDQMQALRDAAQNGTLSQGQLDSLSARFGMSGMDSTQVTTVSRAIGLNPAQLMQVQRNFQRIKGGTAYMPPKYGQPEMYGATPLPTPMFNVPEAQATPSHIEDAFRKFDTGKSMVTEFTGPENLVQFGYDFFSSPANVQMSQAQAAQAAGQAGGVNIPQVGGVPNIQYAQISQYGQYTGQYPEASSQNAPVSPDYILGPGDGLQLMVWGTRTGTIPLQVGRDGTVKVPSIGPIPVAGLRFEDAQKAIQGRVEQITGVHAAVSMGQIRMISVFVVGAVVAPGPYNLTGMSRVTSALVAAGGPTKVGSLRDVQLKRNNQVVSTIDLYAMLLRGDTKADVRLEDRDTIFVPTIGPVVAVAGDVKRPGIFEMSATRQSLSSVLQYAGGISSFASTQQIQIERVDQHQRRIVLDTSIDRVSLQQFTVGDGDLIKIFPVLNEAKNRVTLLGNVYRPGEYQWREGMRLSDVIAMGEGVQPKTYFRYALVKRLEGKQLFPHYIPVDLAAALDLPGGPADIAINKLDTLTIYNQDDLRDLPTVTVIGEVRVPGTYKLDPNMKVSDLIYLSGGLTDAAYQKGVEVARTQVLDGGTTNHAYMDVDLTEALRPGSPEDITLQANDQVYVRSANNWHLPWTVTLSGRVARPGVYTVHEGERLSSLFQRCGGFLPDAFPSGMVFVRKSVQLSQQKRLDQARLELQEQASQVALVQAQLQSTSNSQAGNSANTLAAMQQLLSSTNAMQATGRLVVHYQPDLAQTSDNPTLEIDDQIDIPRTPSSVNVLGQVFNPTSVLVKQHLTVRDYIDYAGGPTTLADMDHMMVIKADGRVITNEGYNNAQRSRIFPMLPLISPGISGATVAAGDTIYVPNRIPDFTNLQITQSMTTIISQSVQAMAIIGILATQI